VSPEICGVGDRRGFATIDYRARDHIDLAWEKCLTLKLEHCGDQASTLWVDSPEDDLLEDIKGLRRTITARNV
jgi:hypothetical protein